MIDHNELLPPGKVLGGFRIETQLGHGNMGIIYRAIQVNLNRPVALKVLFQRVAADQDFVRSFFREAQAAAAFTHQNIVQAFDVGRSEDGTYYFAMELIEGGDIDDQLKNVGPYSAEDAVKLMVSIADGLDYGSSLRKLTHGDIKPANIMLTKGKKPKLADLGLARMGGEIQGESDGIMLTPLYAAPEMIQGQWVVGDPRADMYSVGATLYHMITGAPPFQDDDYRNVIHMQVHNQHTPLCETDSSIPASISKLVDQLLEKDPKDRFATWEEAKKAMTYALDTVYAKESKKKKKVLHYHKADDQDQRKKKKSKAPLLTILVVALAVLGFIALKFNGGDSLTEFEKLKVSIANDSVDDKILKLEAFISKQGTEAPKDAIDELASLLNSQPSGIFDLDFSEIDKQLNEFTQKISNKDAKFINNLKNNSGSFQNRLDNLLSHSLSIHIPFEDSPQNYSSFSPLANISIKGDPQYTEGVVGKAIALEGGSINYGDLPQSRFAKSGSFTISFWLKPNKLTFPILGKCEVGDGQLKKGYLVSLNNGKVQLSLYGDKSENMMDVLTEDVIEVDKWTHITVQYSNETANIFISGSKKQTQVSSTLTQDFSCTGPFVIGFKYFSGIIDEVRIWREQLSPGSISEVAKLTHQSQLFKTITRFNEILTSANSIYLETVSSEDKPRPVDQKILRQASTVNKQLMDLANNIHDWAHYSDKVNEYIEEQGPERNRQFYNLLMNDLKTAKIRLIDTMRIKENWSKISKNYFTQGTYKDYMISRLDRDRLIFGTVKPYGFVHHRFYLDEPNSNEPFVYFVKQTIEDLPKLYKDSLQLCIAAMVISKGKAYPKLSSIVTDPRFRKVLKRMAMEFGL